VRMRAVAEGPRTALPRCGLLAGRHARRATSGVGGGVGRCYRGCRRRATDDQRRARCGRGPSGTEPTRIGPSGRRPHRAPPAEPAEVLDRAFGLFRVGALPVFALPDHRGHELQYFCDHAEAVAYVRSSSEGANDPWHLDARLRDPDDPLRHIITVGPRKASIVRSATSPSMSCWPRAFDRGRRAESSIVTHRAPETWHRSCSPGYDRVTEADLLNPRRLELQRARIRRDVRLRCVHGQSDSTLVRRPRGHDRGPSPPAVSPLIVAEVVTTTALIPWNGARVRRR
jgi:hypothetical protein